MRSRWWSLGALGLLAVAGVALRARWLGPEVPVIQPTRRAVMATIVASGRVLPGARVSVASLALGAVTAVHVDVGDRVTAGQPLVELDDREARAALARAEAAVRAARVARDRVGSLSARVSASDLAGARAARERADAELTRRETLAAAGALPAEALEQARAAALSAWAAEASAQARAEGAGRGGSEASAAAASLAQAEADLHAAEARLAHLHLIAPGPGVVTARNVEPGAVAQAGAALLELALDGPVRLAIEPDEGALASLAIGQPALASPEAFPDARFDAVVSFVAPSVDPARGTIEVRLDVPTPPATLRPDMTVSVEVEVGRREDALTLPSDAVHDVGTDAPWVLVADGVTARHVPIEIGLEGDGAVEVTGGLDAGARVIPATTHGVEAGSRIRVPSR